MRVRKTLGLEQMIKIKTCPTCGSKRIRLVCEDAKFSIRGRQVIVHELDFLRCDNCGERLYDIEASRKIDSVIGRTGAARRRKSA
jgi:YgiT-type zinc finger domain-containing protein